MNHLSMKRIKKIVEKFDSKNLMIIKGEVFSPNAKLQNKIFEKIRTNKNCKNLNQAILLTIVDFFEIIDQNDLIDYADVILTYYQTVLAKKGWTTDQLFEEIKNEKI